MIANSLPKLMFVCALEPKALRALFEDRFVLDDLKSLGAGAALVVRDFSDERAQAVRLLNKLGIPVSAWLLLPGEQGSWLDPTHAAQAAELYQALKRWSGQKGLRWSAVGFGVSEKYANGLGKEAALDSLIERAHADGFAVELVNFLLEQQAIRKKPLVARKKAALDWPDAERFIWLRPCDSGAQDGLLGSAADGKGVARVVSTHKSLNLGASAAEEPKTWQEFAQEVRAARQKSSAVYVFTLEACAKQGFLDRLVTLDWSGQAQSGSELTSRAMLTPRGVLNRKRWLGFAALAGFVGSALLIAKKKRKT
ncbi:MAG: hypothetical protein GYA40_04840 [Chloroflexi bacterium]|nr:hypothetical protein [Chloroflexota bacterium]